MSSELRRSCMLSLKQATLTPCIEWPWATSGNGYGQVSRSNAAGRGRLVYVHRYVYELYHGTIPKVVRHKCDNPRCYNIEHLEGGTAADNSADMVKRGRSARGARHNMSKLTEQDVLAIRGRLAAGDTNRAIAKTYGVTRQNITAIRRGKTWNHV